MTNAEAHRLARAKEPSRLLYMIARALLTPYFRIWAGLRSTGAERIPAGHGTIIAPNHKSVWDPFLIAACSHRRMNFMAKAELFDGPFARLLVRIGAFPVRRGGSDMEAIETARTILERGGALMLFPEGKVVRDPSMLGMPRRGVGRLALETGSCVVPTAIVGSERLRRVRISFAEPVFVEEMASSPEEAGRFVEELLWPSVVGEFEGLLGHSAA